MFPSQSSAQIRLGSQIAELFRSLSSLKSMVVGVIEIKYCSLFDIKKSYGEQQRTDDEQIEEL